MDTEIIEKFEPFDGCYDNDPRVFRNDYSPHFVSLPDDEGEWQLALTAGRWGAWNQQGTFVPEASYKDTAEESICAVIGPPLWFCAAAILVEGINNSGYYNYETDTPWHGLVDAGDLLAEAGLVVPEMAHPDGKLHGYLLTADGIQLAHDVLDRGEDMATIKDLLDEHVITAPQPA